MVKVAFTSFTPILGVKSDSVNGVALCKSGSD